MANKATTLTTPSQSPAPLPCLPQEMITDILLRLPVKTLLKFKCVSKSWLSLISSRHFAKTHLKISAENYECYHKRLIFGSHRLPQDLYSCSVQYAVQDCIYPSNLYPVIEDNLSVDHVSFDCPLDSRNGMLWIVGSCNGLVCIGLSNYILILWNPATGKSKVLPDSGTEFDILCSRAAYGFGYDEFHDDYKVVECLFNYETAVYETQVKVYSLRANSWKTVSHFPDGDLVGDHSKYLNGAIHWSLSRDGLKSLTIATHDLATDTFGELPLPDFENENFRVEIEVLGGCLSVCCYRYSALNIWMMNEYGLGETWTKVVCIPFFSNWTHIYDRPIPLFLLVVGKVLLKYGSSVMIYDSRNPVTLSRTDSFHIEATIYVESLVSPNFDDEISIGRTLPQEIITEILLKLPVKSLLRFRCVSKQWLSLISSSQFINNHLKVSTKANTYSHNRLIFGATYIPVNLYTCQIESLLDDSLDTRFVYPGIDENLSVEHIEYDLFLHDPDDALSIVGSCNGLVCVVVSPNTVYLWNPSTRKSNELPNSGSGVDCCPHIMSYGFGYDELIQDYKVVELFTTDYGIGKSRIKVKAYSLKTGSWRTIPDWPGGICFGGSGKFVNGAIHWLVYNCEVPIVSWAIVSQDVNEDSFDEISQPNYENDDVDLELVVLRGRLSICCDHHTHMDIWVMKEYNVQESWTKVVNITYSMDIRDHEYVRPLPLFFSENGEILINYGSSLVFYSSGHDVSNNPILAFGKCLEVEAETYVESLVPPYFDHELAC